jgi:diguanylate cyclase (GGDEF)-like protein
MALTSLCSLRQKDPASLLRLYVITAAVSIVTIVVLSGFGFYRIFSGFVIKSAETDSVQLCHLLLDQESIKLIKDIPGQGKQLVIDNMVMATLDTNMRKFLHPFNIIKIKIYDLDQRIIYSTEPSLVGKIDDNNLRLKNALAGSVDAVQVTKKRARDLADEPLLDVDVVETYVPIRSMTSNAANMNVPGRVLGSFEIYVDVTRYRKQIITGLVFMSGFTLAVLTAVYGFSYLLIRQGTRQLREIEVKLEMLAITDVLTGIANRGYVMARGEEEFHRAERNQVKEPDAATLCCIMLDIDHFKNVNDTKGHPAGDEVLRAVVGRMVQNVRPYDIIGRYGGEEFLVLLPGTKFDDGVAVAERIRAAVRREPFSIAGDEIRVSVSLGIASYDSKDQNLNELLKRADEGLYKAKHAGRDRVAWVYEPMATDLLAENQDGSLVA